MVRSPQTLTEADRRLVAAWAADCAERVLGLYEAEAPGDDRPRAAIARTRAFARGEVNTAEEIRRRFVGGVSTRDVRSPAAGAASRAAGQAVAVCHMGAHALGAAAYAVKAASLARPNRPEVIDDEIRWQLAAHDGGGTGRPARASASRRELIRSSRAWPPRLRPTRDDYS